MKLKTAITSEQGFTLIEALASIVILSLFVLVLTRLMGVSVTGIMHVSKAAQAQSIAEAQMELINAKAAKQTTIDFLKEDLHYVEEDQILTYVKDMEARFYLKPTSKTVDSTVIPCVKITVVTFYNEGRNYIRLEKLLENVTVSE